jgi:dephospho-CoA kinase
MKDIQINQIFTSSFQEDFKIVEELGKIKKNNHIFYKIKFIDSGNEYIRSKQDILKLNIVDSIKIEQDFISKIYPQNCGDSLLIIKRSELKYRQTYYYECKFIKYPYKCLALKENIIKGKVNNYNKPSILDIGFKGEGVFEFKDYPKISQTWYDMLNRCYNPKNKRFKSYGNLGITVCKEWHNFQNFCEWYLNQLKNYKNIENLNLQIDKDLIPYTLRIDIKEYNPNYCVLLPKDLNIFFKFKNELFSCIRKNNSGNYIVNIVFKKGEDCFYGVFDNLLSAIQNKYLFFNKIKIKYIQKYKNILPENIINLIQNISFFSDEKRIICFVGSSGSGKSTLLSYIKDNYNIKVEELSARKFLKPNIPYYEQLNDKIQNQIVFNNTIKILSSIAKKENIVYSRSLLDPYIYSLILKKSNHLNLIQEEVIKDVSKYIIYIYTPSNFELTNLEKNKDKERGDNEKLRQETNKYIKKYLKQFNILNFELFSPNLNERKEYIDNLMNILNIDKK